MFTRYLEEIKLSRGDKTYTKYAQILRKFENKPINMGTVKEIMNLNMSINSKKFYLSVWIRALKFYKKDCEEVERFTKTIHTQEKLAEAPTQEAVEKIINSTTDKKIKLLVSLMSYAGLRISEAQNMLIKDISLEENKFIIRNTKNHTDRLCIINSKLKPLLIEWLNSKDRNKGDYVFNSPRGGKYTTNYLKDIVKNHCIKAGYPALHCHSFRHYFATNFYQKSHSNIALTARACGHKSISTTMRYIATSASDLANIINKF